MPSILVSVQDQGCSPYKLTKNQLTDKSPKPEAMHFCPTWQESSPAGANVIKLFYGYNLQMGQISLSVCTW